MHRGNGDGRPTRVDGNAPILHDAEARTQQRFRRRGAEAQNHLGLDELELILEPRKTGSHFAGTRGLVQPALGAGVARPLEVLDGIGDVDIVAVDSRDVECVIEQTARGTNEGSSLLVLLIARLLTNSDDARRTRTLAEHGLRAHLPQVAAPATSCCSAKLGKIGIGRNEVSG